MKILNRFSVATLASLILFIPAAFASAASVSISSLAPSASVFAKTNITFTVVASGFTVPQYRLVDSFSGTTIASGNINPGGQFSWVPVLSDIGTHNITVYVTDTDGNSSSATQTVTIMPPPSIAIQSVTPGSTMMPGETMTFTVVPTGFSNPVYTVSDSFNGSTINPTSIGSSGSFSWKPDISQNGEHTITVFTSDTRGYSSNAQVSVRVGAGPKLAMPPNFATPTIKPGQTVTFNLLASGYMPSAFTLSDKFSGSTSLTSTNINSVGLFVWTPQAADAGVHTITFTGQVGNLGATASVTQVINVTGPDGTVPGTQPVVPVVSTSSISLSDLQAKLALLQQQTSVPPSAAASSASPSNYTFVSNLKQGSSGSEVTELQKLLAKHGYLTVAPNGYFGPSTRAAVMKFQAANKLTQLGSVGPGTRAALNALIGGSSSTVSSPAVAKNRFVFEHFMGVGDDDQPDVVELQKRLVQLGLMLGEPSGFYGPTTEAAVKKYQALNNLPETGYVSSITRMVLNQN